MCMLGLNMSIPTGLAQYFAYLLGSPVKKKKKKLNMIKDLELF